MCTMRSRNIEVDTRKGGKIKRTKTRGIKDEPQALERIKTADSKTKMICGEGGLFICTTLRIKLPSFCFFFSFLFSGRPYPYGIGVEQAADSDSKTQRKQQWAVAVLVQHY